MDKETKQDINDFCAWLLGYSLLVFGLLMAIEAMECVN